MVAENVVNVAMSTAKLSLYALLTTTSVFYFMFRVNNVLFCDKLFSIKMS